MLCKSFRNSKNFFIVDCGKAQTDSPNTSNFINIRSQNKKANEKKSNNNQHMHIKSKIF